MGKTGRALDQAGGDPAAVSSGSFSPRCAFKKHRCSRRSASLLLRVPWLQDGFPSAAAAFLPVATRDGSSIRTRRQRWRSLIGRARFLRASHGCRDIGTSGDAPGVWDAFWVAGSSVRRPRKRTLPACDSTFPSTHERGFRSWTGGGKNETRTRQGRSVESASLERPDVSLLRVSEVSSETVRFSLINRIYVR